MNYTMEELVPLVGRLAERYTSFESTSVTYEKAEQLMGAVLYCIGEYEGERHEDGFAVSAAGVSAGQAYEAGYRQVGEKVKESIALYHKILSEFVCFDNRCLYDTFVKGLPEFFGRYDAKFDPQNTILTLDYPVLKDISGYRGIDRIYEFIRCVDLEQKFLCGFSQDEITDILSSYSPAYRDIMDNLCEIVLMVISGRVLTEMGPAKLRPMVERFVRERCENCDELTEYLMGALDGILARLKVFAP